MHDGTIYIDNIGVPKDDKNIHDSYGRGFVVPLRISCIAQIIWFVTYIQMEIFKEVERILMIVPTAKLIPDGFALRTPSSSTTSTVHIE